jgi:hypothetical protein
MIRDGNILRVCVHKDRDCISIINLDTNALDTEGEGLYINIEDVPDWIQRKLAVLMMVNTHGADITTPEIEGVGRRISNGGAKADCFWVYKDNR